MEKAKIKKFDRWLLLVYEIFGLVFSLCLSASVYAWECPVCKKSFASVGFVAHTCDQSTVLPTQLTNLISNSGFAFHPSSRINALSIIGDYLEYLPLYEKTLIYHGVLRNGYTIGLII